MCSNRHHLFIITMVSANINGEWHRIYTYSVQHSEIAKLFLILPSDLVHKIRAKYSTYY
jgi:cell division protein FtsW (lipid II flippase)